MPGGQILDLGGGSDNPGPNGGGNTVRTFNPCTDQTCDIVEARSQIPALPAVCLHHELGLYHLVGWAMSALSGMHHWQKQCTGMHGNKQ